MKSSAAEQHAAVERVDLLVDLALLRGERHGENGFGRAHDHRRGGQQVLEVADAFARDGRGFPPQRERAVDVGVGAGGQQARGEQVALAGGDQPRAGEDVGVLIDQARHPHHQVVVHAGALQHRAPLHEVLDHARGGRGGALRFGLDVRSHLVGDEVARDDRQQHHRHEHRGDEREEQLAVEAGAHLAQQRRPVVRRRPTTTKTPLAQSSST